MHTRLKKIFASLILLFLLASALCGLVSAVTAPPPEEGWHDVWLGQFTLHAYCPCYECCGKWALNRPVDENGNEIIYTASGNVAKAGVTVATGEDFPFGTRLLIGDHEYIVQDRGVETPVIDIYFPTHEEAWNFGEQYADVWMRIPNS